MNAIDVMDLAEQIQRSSERMAWYLQRACGPYSNDEYMADMAMSYARMSGHFANQLIDLAERGIAT